MYYTRRIGAFSKDGEGRELTGEDESADKSGSVVTVVHELWCCNEEKQGRKKWLDEEI
jgi:hypothetical protein